MDLPLIDDSKCAHIFVDTNGMSSQVCPRYSGCDPQIIVVVMHQEKHGDPAAQPYIAAVQGWACCRTMASSVYFGQM